MSKKIIFIIIFIILLGGIFFVDKFIFQRVKNAPEQIFSPDTNTIENLETSPALTTYVSNRRIIWAIDFLPDGRMIFTERDGTVSVVGIDGKVDELLSVDVHAIGESGLHGTAIDPEFEENNFIYLYYTYESDRENTLNRVSRFIYKDMTLNEEKIILDNIPGASTHDGGRIKFGPDSLLYVTTGDAQIPSLSQDKTSLAGKILRVTRDGEPALDNPFGTHMYSYGHRNPQGITWDNQGKLWATEHGPSAQDELNQIEAGANYGWPEITGTSTKDGMHSPVIQSGRNTWAPAGAVYWNGSIFFAGLRGSALYEYNITTNKLETHLINKFGRIRDVIIGPDNFLYIATSNRDGRGIPTENDDRILKINPLKLSEI
jgi:glucose/arabinose dehydrogenase